MRPPDSAVHWQRVLGVFSQLLRGPEKYRQVVVQQLLPRAVRVVQEHSHAVVEQALTYCFRSGLTRCVPDQKEERQSFDTAENKYLRRRTF